MSDRHASRNDELEPIEDVVKRDASGWAHNLYNCTTGDNYLKGAEYYDLIRTLDDYARENADLKARLSAVSESVPSEMRRALEESVRLQSHYAELLNMHDGGQRMTFTADTWMKRLTELAAKDNDE